MDIKKENINEDILNTISDNIKDISLYKGNGIYSIFKFSYMKGFNDCFSLNFISGEDDITLHHINKVSFTKYHESDIRYHNILRSLTWEEIYIIHFFEKGNDTSIYFCISRGNSWIKHLIRELNINNLLDV